MGFRIKYFHHSYFFLIETYPHGRWRELDYMGIEFKRVSAASNVVWALGADHQTYVFVYGVEVPIR